MGSTIGHRIDYNGVGALRGHAATHTQQALTQVPPRICVCLAYVAWQPGGGVLPYKRLMGM